MPNSPQVSPSASDVFFRVCDSRRAFSGKKTAFSENSEGAGRPAPRLDPPVFSSNRTTSIRSCRVVSSERSFVVSRLLKADVAASSRLGRDPNRPDARRSFKAANLDAVDRAAARTRSERSKVSARKGVTEFTEFDFVTSSSSWKCSSAAKLGVPLNARSAFSPPRSGVSGFASDESRAPIFGVTRVARARRASSPPSGSASSGRVSSGT